MRVAVPDTRMYVVVCIGRALHLRTDASQRFLYHRDPVLRMLVLHLLFQRPNARTHVCLYDVVILIARTRALWRFNPFVTVLLVGGGLEMVVCPFTVLRSEK